jgi:protein required for attachment to host cells
MEGYGHMDKVKIHEGDWVVVCDGRKALILENIGDWKFPNLHTHEVKEHEVLSTRELGTDAPGRVQQSVGTATSSVEQTDWHRESERAFLEQLAGRLDAAVASGRPKRLIVIAPPRALGTLRQAFSPAVRAAVETEIAHDYVKLTVGEIEKRLFG